MNLEYIWVIQSNSDRNIIGCFIQKELAEQFIQQHQLQCSLVQMPIDISVYDWVIQKGYWQPKSDLQKSAKFIEKFSSAYLKHEHFKEDSQ